ncbi:hypothetical protein FOMPIDRAFT_1020985 [Fomitopsis schrenkii]|uniref:Uncharacterized protein n=1 Tax=Fomitopsis schrenkii TaxID=2126942 RepID=S8DMJ4_FOMSC|nr:hypothetical protein FOMPIDRAFT_1020985 [Fomitopsis schrenkii]
MVAEGTDAFADVRAVEVGCSSLPTAWQATRSARAAGTAAETPSSTTRTGNLREQSHYPEAREGFMDRQRLNAESNDRQTTQTPKDGLLKLDSRRRERDFQKRPHKRPENPKFAQAYGGLPSSHRRPAVVTCWCYDEYGALRGFKFAPITSTLRIQVCDPTAWAAVDWGRSSIPVPPSIHNDVRPVRIQLKSGYRMRAKPSYIWVKDEGEFISLEDWSWKVGIGEACLLDSDLGMSQGEIQGCRCALKSIASERSKILGNQ